MNILNVFKSFSALKKSLIITGFIGVVLLIGIVLGINHNNDLMAKTNQATTEYTETASKVNKHTPYFNETENKALREIKNEQQEAYESLNYTKIKKLNVDLLTLSEQCHDRHLNPLKLAYDGLSLSSKSTVDEQEQLASIKGKIEKLLLAKDLSKTDEISKHIKEADKHITTVTDRISAEEKAEEEARLAKIEAQRIELERLEAERIAQEQAAIREAEIEAQNKANTYEAPVSNLVTSQTGSKYHYSGCRILKKPGNPTTVEDAKSRGYGACKVCNPPQ